eukprot:Skav232356  [mRNA]  locus=scaffold2646:527268:527513:+ [translate_table: standard]
MARFVLALTACTVLLMASTFVAPRAPSSTAPRVVPQPQQAPEVDAEQQQQQPVLAVLLGLVLGALTSSAVDVEVDSPNKTQ